MGSVANKNHIREGKGSARRPPRLNYPNTKATQMQKQLAVVDMDLKQRWSTTKTPKAHHHPQKHQ